MSNVERLAPPKRRPPICVPGASLRGWLDHLQPDRSAGHRPRGRWRCVSSSLPSPSGSTAARPRSSPSPDGHSVSVVSGLVSDRGWIAEAMGVGETGAAGKIRAGRAQSGAVARGQDRRRCRSMSHRTVDLGKLLPLPTHNELDNGPYITAGLAITRNPATAVAERRDPPRCSSAGRTASARCCCSGPRSIISRCSEREGKDLPIAIVVGVDPLTLSGLAGHHAERLRRARNRRRAARPAARRGAVFDQRHPRAGRGRNRPRGPRPAQCARAGRPVRRISAILRRAARPPCHRDRRRDAPHRAALPHHLRRRPRAPDARRHSARGDHARASAPHLPQRHRRTSVARRRVPLSPLRADARSASRARPRT